MILEPGCEFCVTTRFEHDWCSIFVSTTMLARGSDLAEPSSDSEKIICRVTSPNRQIANQFRALVHRVITSAAGYPQFDSSPAATCAEAELLKVASVVVGKQQVGEPCQVGRARLPREEIIRHSKELLEEREGESVHVGQLAAAAEVSERTLRTAFKDYFGVGPARYLRLRQLHQVYRALRAADPEAVSVADVLHRNGVWEFSRIFPRSAGRKVPATC